MKQNIRRLQCWLCMHDDMEVSSWQLEMFEREKHEILAIGRLLQNVRFWCIPTGTDDGQLMDEI